MKTDPEIQKNVMEELRWEPLLNAAEIGVAVKNGVVTLSGTVDRYLKKREAEKATKRVAGVKAVAEDIEVKISDAFRKTDAEIADAVLNALKWHSSIQDEKIKVTVEDGWVTLEGEAQWEFQRSSARSSVENLIGVKGISNNIKIVSRVVLKEVKQKITSAFHRSATIDADKINIETAAGKVILTGKVNSWSEKRDAENAAWACPGVDRVDNKLEVESEIFAY
ncbi:MAG: BON domain-containing protein [Bacteroidetes bacterium]|nr:BON domain-containing protein [Bacteroidota bacterium]